MSNHRLMLIVLLASVCLAQNSAIGGLVFMTTRSGTNDFHGALYDRALESATPPTCIRSTSQDSDPQTGAEHESL